MAPTFDAGDPGLQRDYKALTNEQRRQYRRAVRDLVADLKAGRAPRPGLRVKRVQGTKDVWEMTWAPNGRATFHYGTPQQAGESHIVWRRIGTHTIFNRP